jgi:crotonobetainyl-CoA:carnitine CoA-transferase CaiB-like acyl-CoA transferase
MGKALQDVLVLDLGQIYNGPYCSMLLAFQGAKVVKIEPLGGEALRNRFGKGEEPHEFLILNSNKLGVSINLKAPEGKNLFLKMVEKADVVVENFSRGVMDRLSLGYEVLKEVNPRLIYASGTGYGLEGPYADLPAMDLTIQAMGGVMSTTGYPDGPPLKAGPAFGDFMGGIHLFGGIVTALYQRERTGRGQLVEVSMHDTIYPTLASPLGGLYNQERKIPERTGNHHSGLAYAPYNVYPVRDGHVAIFCISERHWISLAKRMGRDDLISMQKFSSNPDRAQHMQEIDELVGSWTVGFEKWNLVHELLAARVPCAPVLSLAEVAEDPHLKSRGMIHEIDHPKAGRTPVPGSPIRLSDSPLEEVIPAPLLGEHTEEVVRGVAGIEQRELDVLREGKIVE